MTDINRRNGMLSREGSAAVLENPDFLPGLPREAAHRLAAASTRLLYPDGATVFMQGDLLPGLFVVVQGALRIYRADGRGNVQAIDTLAPGTCVGEAQVFDGGVAASSAAAQGRTECWLVPAETLRAMAAEDPGIAACLLRNLAGKVRHLLSLVECLGLHSVPERVGRVILEQQSRNPARAVVEFKETQEHLAQRIGASRECFSRALRSLTDTGMIQNSFPVVRVLDSPRLHEFSGINHTTFSYGSGFAGGAAAPSAHGWAGLASGVAGERGA